MTPSHPFEDSVPNNEHEQSDEMGSAEPSSAYAEAIEQASEQLQATARKLTENSLSFIREQAHSNPYGFLQMGLLLGAGLTAVQLNQARKLLQVGGKFILLNALPLLLKGPSSSSSVGQDNAGRNTGQSPIGVEPNAHLH